MERTVYWTIPVVNDVENIRDYIARDSKQYALAFVQNVLDSARSLYLFAERGRVIPEIEESSVRELFIKRY